MVGRSAGALFLTLSIALVTAGPAQARLIKFGSTLKATPTIAEKHPVDSTFWPWSSPGHVIRAPARGQVLWVTVKGRVLRRHGKRPENRVLFQTLAPRSKGRRRVRLTSAPFLLPIGGNRNRLSTYRPENLCARKGDAVGLSNVGGFTADYPHGAPFQIFGAVPRARTARFTRSGGIQNGSTLTPRVRKGAELLMQVVLGTGANASAPCR